MTTSVRMLFLNVLLLASISHGAELRRFETTGRVISSKKLVGVSFAPKIAWTPYFQLNSNWTFNFTLGVSRHSSETGNFTSYQTLAGLKYTGWNNWSPEVQVGNEMWKRVYTYNGFTYAVNLHYHPTNEILLSEIMNLKLDSLFLGYSGLNITGDDFQQGVGGIRFTFGRDSAPEVAGSSNSRNSVSEAKISQGTGSNETIVAEINFEQNQWGLTQSMVQELNAAVEKLNSYPSAQIKIQGHTNSYGSDQQNNRISELRAQNVKYYLAKKGISKNRMTIEALGSSMPAVAGKSAEAKKRNRRALILVVE